MTEHLNTYQFTTGSCDVLFFYLAVDVGHLFHLQLTRQHYHIGKLSIELQCLDIRNIQLCREMHLYTFLTAILHDGNVTSNDGTDLGLFCGINNLVHRLNVFTIDNGINGEVRLYTSGITCRCNLAQVVNGEVVS